MSIFIFSGIGMYMHSLILIMMNRSNSTFNISSEIVNLNSDNTKYHLFNDYGFSFAVSLTLFNGSSVQVDESYFNLTIYYWFDWNRIFAINALNAQTKLILKFKNPKRFLAQP